MTVEAVDEIAQGRVWAGSDALEIGLVDQIGTLEDAVSYAMASIGGSDLSAYQIAEYPKPLTTIEKLMESFGGNNASVLKGTPFEPVEKAFRDWNGSNSGQVYARLPYEFEFK